MYADSRSNFRKDPKVNKKIATVEVVKGYEYARSEFVTFTAEELKALDVESSKVIDLEKFVPPDDIDPVYFDSSCYLYLDGPIAVEALRVIGAAMAEAGVAGLGRLTLSRRERMVMVAALHRNHPRRSKNDKREPNQSSTRSASAGFAPTPICAVAMV